MLPVGDFEWPSRISKKIFDARIKNGTSYTLATYQIFSVGRGRARHAVPLHDSRDIGGEK
jgi:hypothetical protein